MDGIDTSNYILSLAPQISARYKEKIKLYCDNIDPYCLNLAECSENVKDLPNITEHQIHSYLLLSKCPYTGLAGNRKLDYEDPSKTGCVMKIGVKKLEDISIVLGEICILETGEYLNPWFVSFPYGYVLCAHCTCSSGTNEMCIHIGGLLHKVHLLKVAENYLTDSISNGESLTPAQKRKRLQQKLYVCGICSSQFSNKNRFKQHCQRKHALPTYSQQQKMSHNKQKQTTTDDEPQLEEYNENDQYLVDLNVSIDSTEQVPSGVDDHTEPEFIVIDDDDDVDDDNLAK